MPSIRCAHPDSSFNDLIAVRDSAVHGQGVFARVDIMSGTCIGTYEGQRYNVEEAKLENWTSGLTYLFGLSDGTMIDGAKGGNATRHLNHACAPNCEAREEFSADGSIVLRVFATRAVGQGAELFLDYALVIDPSESPSLYPCRCGNLTCRGSMAAVVADRSSFAGKRRRLQNSKRQAGPGDVSPRG
ncbi:SET domain-containing protein [Variovorax sp. GT1P44]|uniref:SET domain-containing protein n=1 Tax=Variovorax sp. GT1P44 TaxID=3443742 RepID=UPI003F450524